MFESLEEQRIREINEMSEEMLKDAKSIKDIDPQKILPRNFRRKLKKRFIEKHKLLSVKDLKEVF